jgi:hypothetical protein
MVPISQIAWFDDIPGPAPDGDPLLQRALRRAIAYAKWGTEGAYRVDATLDDAIRHAVGAFGLASKLLGPEGSSGEDGSRR